MVYILTVITVWDWGRVETEIEGVYLSYEKAKERIKIIEEDYKEYVTEKEILNQTVRYEYKFTIAQFYLKY